MQAEKKAKQEVANPSVKVHMGLMAQLNKEVREKLRADALNPMLNNLQAKLPIATTVKNRVPEAALSIKDPLNMQKEVADLTNQLKQLFFENKQAKMLLN